MGMLYYGDNLDILRRYLNDESVNLVYLDPPFNYAQNYNAFFQEKDGSAAASQIHRHFDFAATVTAPMETEAARAGFYTDKGGASHAESRKFPRNFSELQPCVSTQRHRAGGFDGFCAFRFRRNLSHAGTGSAFWWAHTDFECANGQRLEPGCQVKSMKLLSRKPAGEVAKRNRGFACHLMNNIRYSGAQRATGI